MKQKKNSSKVIHILAPKRKRTTACKTIILGEDGDRFVTLHPNKSTCIKCLQSVCCSLLTACNNSAKIVEEAAEIIEMAAIYDSKTEKELRRNQ